MSGILERVLGWVPGDDEIPEGSQMTLSDGASGEGKRKLDAIMADVLVAVVHEDHRQKYIAGRFRFGDDYQEFERAENWQEIEARINQALAVALLQPDGLLGAYVGELLVYECPQTVKDRVIFSE